VRHSLFLLVTTTIASSAQSSNEDKTAFASFIKRVYAAAPFDGVKILDLYNSQYLVSIVSLSKAKYNSESTLFRVAQVKAQSQANTFLNGATISMDMVITTKELKDTANNITSIVETVESIKQNSSGFSQGLELLTNFNSSDNEKMVFIYFRRMVGN
jgi:hypothetical protein